MPFNDVRNGHQRCLPALPKPNGVVALEVHGHFNFHSKLSKFLGVHEEQSRAAFHAREFAQSLADLVHNGLHLGHSVVVEIHCFSEGVVAAPAQVADRVGHEFRVGDGAHLK